MRNWIFNDWNEKQIVGQRSRTLLYSTAELFKSDEFNLAHLFKIPYKQLMDLYYALSKDVHISYTDFNQMPWYEILMVTESHNDFIEKQNGDSDEQNDMIASQQAQMQSMYNQQQSQMSKFTTPSLPNMNDMNINMPNF